MSPLPTGPPVLFLLLAHPLDGATYVANSGGASVCVCVCVHVCILWVSGAGLVIQRTKFVYNSVILMVS